MCGEGMIVLFYLSPRTKAVRRSILNEIGVKTPVPRPMILDVYPICCACTMY